jgi:hypothetical protein
MAPGSDDRSRRKQPELTVQQSVAAADARSLAIASQLAAVWRASRDGSVKYEILRPRATVSAEAAVLNASGPKRNRLLLTTNTFSGNLMASTGKMNWVLPVQNPVPRPATRSAGESPAQVWLCSDDAQTVDFPHGAGLVVFSA